MLTKGVISFEQPGPDENTEQLKKTVKLIGQEPKFSKKVPSCGQEKVSHICIIKGQGNATLRTK